MIKNIVLLMVLLMVVRYMEIRHEQDRTPDRKGQEIGNDFGSLKTYTGRY